jgi:Asp/Glu/hydantoin racemase
LINPNTSAQTTEMMVDIARAVVPAGVTVDGVTAASGVPMIVTPEELDAAGPGVVAMGVAEAASADGIIVGAFGDPGIEELQARVSIPVVGICEGSALEAARGERRFGIATVTPLLKEAIEARVRQLGLGDLYTGLRLTPGEPRDLSSQPERLEDELAIAVSRCLEDDKAQAVVIGGGPLGQAAIALSRRFEEPLIAPVPAALGILLEQIAAGRKVRSEDRLVRT